MSNTSPTVSGRHRRKASLPEQPRYPALYQINSRVWLRRLSDRAGRHIGLDEVPDGEIDALAAAGFDWVWLLSVWETGEAARNVSRCNAGWRETFQRLLPDLSDDDICGSGFAVADYSVSQALGGSNALAYFRRRLAQRGIRLMLDFVPNHTGLDHHWARESPGFYVEGTEEDLARAPANYVRLATARGIKILAHGRDPNFSGWPDTLQLNYGCREAQHALQDTLRTIAGQCDGVRCDMAMLVLPEVFKRTWGIAAQPFWPDAIEQVRAIHPRFMFMAEVYWDMEWALQQQGFDYCYDKRLYDRLRGREAHHVRDHLAAELGYQAKLARFLENHDEPRAAASFPNGVYEAAAVATYLAPGLRLFHQGQLEGARSHVPTHLCRGPDESPATVITHFYQRLFDVLRLDTFRNGAWQLLTPEPAWADNPSHEGFLAYAWTGFDQRRVLVVVNFRDGPGQCRIPLPFGDLEGQAVLLRDLVGAEIHRRNGTKLRGPGLYIDHVAWQYNVFDIRPVAPANPETPPRRAYSVADKLQETRVDHVFGGEQPGGG